jgi:tetratricopeptide (TPR) repeat protein
MFQRAWILPQGFHGRERISPLNLCPSEEKKMATAEKAWKRVDEAPLQSTARVLSPAPDPGKRTENPAQRSRPSRFSGVLDYFKHRDQEKTADNPEHYLKLSAEHPESADLHLKLAEVYSRRGEEKEAIGQYLKASEIFIREQSIPQAMAVYKQVLSLNPHLVEVNLKMGEIYAKMGMIDEAISQYRIVGKYYARFGRREKIPEIASLLRALESGRRSQENKPDPRDDSLKIPGARRETLSLSASRMSSLAVGKKAPASPGKQERNNEMLFDLGAELASEAAVEWKGVKEIPTDKFSGFEEILKELRDAEIPRDVYPDFHYYMGMACREMGFNDGAIEQLQIAFQNNQKPVESARLLSRCFREKGWFQEAQKYFEKAQEIESHAQKRTVGFKAELVMMHS